MLAILFIENKYTRIYYAIIEQAKTRTLPIDSYVERHHIIPQSFYKSRNKTGWLSGDCNAKKNFVFLTAREHYICHRLLTKMTEGLALYKMANAMRRLAHSPKTKKFITSRTYEHISKLQSEVMKGRRCSLETKEKIRQGNLNRLPMTEETRHKLSEAAKRRKGFTPEGRARAIAANTGRKHTEETKQKLREARARQVERQGDVMPAESRKKLSEAAKGRVLSTEHKEKIGKGNKGKSRSDEYKRQISLRMTGRVKSKETLDKLREKASKEPKPQVTCPHCGKIGGEPSMKRWHMDKCRLQ
jgi:5-methylcytosine-specific restriction endonuclease McrA